LPSSRLNNKINEMHDQQVSRRRTFANALCDHQLRSLSLGACSFAVLVARSRNRGGVSIRKLTLARGQSLKIIVRLNVQRIVLVAWSKQAHMSTAGTTGSAWLTSDADNIERIVANPLAVNGKAHRIVARSQLQQRRKRAVL
jgi:hypothetical protein